MNKNKKTISELVKEKIHSENVKPIPKWHFFLKHGFLWILLMILMTIGAIAVGVSIFEFADIEWDLRPLLGLGLGGFLITIFPYFWLLFFGLVVVLGYFNFMATPKGYKYPKYQIVIFGLLLIILTGVAVHYLGFARSIRDRAGDNPFLRQLMHNPEEVWNNPKGGLLAGEILSVDENDSTATVKSFDGQEWEVNIANVQLPAGKSIIPGQKVKIVGKIIGENIFEAKEARPWRKGDPLNFKEKLKNGPMDGTGPKRDGFGLEKPPTENPNF